MSKPNSGLFKKTSGTRACLSDGTLAAIDAVVAPHRKMDSEGVQVIAASSIRFSQSSVNDVQPIVDSMRTNGWVGEPIDAVLMPDGVLTAIDNTRVVAARIAGIDVKANVHAYDEPITDLDTARRLVSKKGKIPRTWGEGVTNRIARQNSKFRKESPFGSFGMGRTN